MRSQPTAGTDGSGSTGGAGGSNGDGGGAGAGGFAGGVCNFGSVPFVGSQGGQPLNAPIVGMAR